MYRFICFEYMRPLLCSVALHFEIDCLRQSQDKKRVCAEMAKPGSTTPHDELFRALLSDRERAGAFLCDHLPNEIAGHLQSDPPEIVEDSFIDEPLRSTQSDVLLEVKTKSNDPTFVYVLAEHKSTPDIALPLQLAGYMVEI